MAFPASPNDGDTHDTSGYRFTFNSGRWERTRSVLSLDSKVSDPPNDLPARSLSAIRVQHASGGTSRPLLRVSEGAVVEPIGAEAELIGKIDYTSQLDHRGIANLGAYERVLIAGFFASPGGSDIWMRMVDKSNGYIQGGSKVSKHTSRFWWNNSGEVSQKGWSGHWYNIGRAGEFSNNSNVDVYIEIIGNRDGQRQGIGMHVHLMGQHPNATPVIRQSYLNIVNTTINRVDFRLVSRGNSHLNYIGYRTEAI